MIEGSGPSSKIVHLLSLLCHAHSLLQESRCAFVSEAVGSNSGGDNPNGPGLLMYSGDIESNFDVHIHLLGFGMSKRIYGHTSRS